jgi:hypothetical protein
MKLFKLMIIIINLMTLTIYSSEYVVKINKEKYVNSVIIESAQKCMVDYNQNGSICEKLLISEFGLNCQIGELNSVDKSCSVIIDEIRTVTCSSGYTDEGNGFCSGNSVVSASQSCPTYYSPYSGSKCYRDRTKAATESGCPSGYSNLRKDGVWACRQKIGYANVCPSNYWFDSEMGICTTTNGGSPWYLSSTCASGTKYGDNCYNENNIVNYNMSCSSGYTLNGTVCEGRFYANKVYTCNSGYTLSGSKCSKTITEVAGLSACSSDYIEINDSLCQKTIIESAEISCPDTYLFNVDNDNCEKLDVMPLK